MVDETLLLNVQKAFKIVKELNDMSLEELKNICIQNGEKASGLAKDELILLILKNRLSEREFSDYQKYMNYHYFRLGMSGLSSLENSIEKIQGIYGEKAKLSSEKKMVENRKMMTELALIQALSLARLNIEYSRVQRELKDYISRRTKNGMEISAIGSDLEYIRSRNLFYRLLNKDKEEELEQKKHDACLYAKIEEDVMYKNYVSAIKKYCDELKSLFFQMLDTWEIANALHAYRNLEKDVNKPEFYKLASMEQVSFTLDEKEAIYADFLEKTSFDPEKDVTGQIFFDAVKQYVTKYYSILEGRIAVKQSTLANDIKSIVDGQKEMINSVYSNLGMQYGADGETLALLYSSDKKKR